jgi:dephospho-CoA kinase
MMKWIGLTGGIGTGKTTVAEFIKQSGYPVINADEVAHQALSPVGPIFHHIIKAFGGDILSGEGEIDRRRLGAKIFKNEEQRLKLESLIHPYVKQEVKSWRSALEKQGQKLAFYDVPLLFEKNMQSEFDKVVVVWCDEKLQMERLLKRSGFSPIEAKDRIASQLPMKDKKARADFLIENNSTLEALRTATAGVIRQILGQ